MPTATSSAAIVSSASGACESSGTPTTSNGVSCNISGSSITYASQFASTLGLTDSNSAGNPVLASSYYFTNPGTFAVSGTVFGAARTVLNDTPSALSAQQFYATFTFTEQSTAPTFLPNTPFTCTAYDNGTLLGSASATTGGGTSGGTITATASCYIAYPSFAVASTAAMIVLPSASFNAGDVYTFLLSQ
jgi:hypothetical protein